MRTTTAKERIALNAIAGRLESTRRYGQDEIDTIRTSIAICHMDAIPLDLDMLAEADLPMMIHDIEGIDRNMCRETRQMLNCFLPKCALPGGS